MKRAIISQPMRGKTEAQIREERELIIQYLNDKGYEVIDTVFPDFTNNGNIPGLKYLAKSLEYIADADVVYFMKGWESARGCRIEHEACREYGIDSAYAPASTFGPFDFSAALTHVKRGMRIYREAWNGKGQYVYMQEGMKIKNGMARNEVLAGYLEAVGEAKIHSHLDMKNAQGEIIVGWAASQTDMLAEDWYAM